MVHIMDKGSLRLVWRLIKGSFISLRNKDSPIYWRVFILRSKSNLNDWKHIFRSRNFPTVGNNDGKTDEVNMVFCLFWKRSFRLEVLFLSGDDPTPFTLTENPVGF